VDSHRFPISNSLLEEFLKAASMILTYPESRSLAVAAIHSVHARAVEDLIPEILLQSSCVLDSLELGDYSPLM
jgi:hypothetical protein